MSLKYTFVVRIVDRIASVVSHPRLLQPCVLFFLTFSPPLFDGCRFDLLDAVVLWDWIISLPREYRFVRGLWLLHHILSFFAQIWSTHWTPVKLAYLFCRQVFRFRAYMRL